jgi:hypothetical protein
MKTTYTLTVWLYANPVGYSITGLSLSRALYHIREYTKGTSAISDVRNRFELHAEGTLLVFAAGSA